MRPDPKERLEILKVEMSLIQGTFDKYDDLIFRCPASTIFTRWRQLFSPIAFGQ